MKQRMRYNSQQAGKHAGKALRQHFAAKQAPEKPFECSFNEKARRNSQLPGPHANIFGALALQCLCSFAAALF
jgi:hypothetical protein